jgi:hypothetical protein
MYGEPKHGDFLTLLLALIDLAYQGGLLQSTTSWGAVVCIVLSILRVIRTNV